VNAFRRSLVDNPEHPSALTNMGYCLIDLNRPAEAVPIFESVLAQRPEHYDGLYGLALAHELQDHSREAKELWHRYIQEAPESVWKQHARDRLERLRASRF
jgi:tetratricopeptide (TPR) repeat protein